LQNNIPAFLYLLNKRESHPPPTPSSPTRDLPAASATHRRTLSLDFNSNFCIPNPMKHVVKILTILVTISAFWIGLLETSVVPRSHTWLLPIYFIVSLGCYGLLMVAVGLMRFPTCPQEAQLLQQDILEAKEFLKAKGVDVGSG
ncbi:DPM3 domain-containing protein, partial [Cephalotus follicularis]